MPTDTPQVTEALLAFVSQPQWSENAEPPEDNADWRAGYEAAQDNLREALKPWWPLGGPLRPAARPTVSGDFAPNETDRFLLAYVSSDTKQIGLDHPTNASWESVLAAHVALRDRLNERIAEMDKCPFSPPPAMQEEPALSTIESPKT